MLGFSTAGRATEVVCSARAFAQAHAHARGKVTREKFNLIHFLYKNSDKQQLREKGENDAYIIGHVKTQTKVLQVYKGKKN